MLELKFPLPFPLTELLLLLKQSLLTENITAALPSLSITNTSYMLLLASLDILFAVTTYKTVITLLNHNIAFSNRLHIGEKWLQHYLSSQCYIRRFIAPDWCLAFYLSHSHRGPDDSGGDWIQILGHCSTGRSPECLLEQDLSIKPFIVFVKVLKDEVTEIY